METPTKGCLPFTSLVLAVLMAVLCLVSASCGNSAAYQTDVPVTDLCFAVDSTLEAPSEFAEMTEDYIKGMMQIDPAEFAEYAVKMRVSGTNIDEYGIFKVASEAEVQSAAETVKAYLNMRIEAWMPEYIPEEFPKLQNASVKVMGQYVIYCILDNDTKIAAFSAAEEMLTDK